MKAKEFFELAAKEIFYAQGFVGESVKHPDVVILTKDTAEATAGNLRLCMCETIDDRTLKSFLDQATKTKELGIGLRVNEHFVGSGCYFVETKVPVHWYLAARNEILPEH
ncbi:MAG: hypothetical protein QW404_02350 [Candidatus Nanoarchaeia archaeon]